MNASLADERLGCEFFGKSVRGPKATAGCRRETILFKLARPLSNFALAFFGDWGNAPG
jgi:hypothetical protein